MKKHGKKRQDCQPSRSRLTPRTPLDLGEQVEADDDTRKTRSRASRLGADRGQPRADEDETLQQRAARKAQREEALAQDEESEEDDGDTDGYEDDEEDSSRPVSPSHTNNDVKPKVHFPTDADHFAEYAQRLRVRRSTAQSMGLRGEATGLRQLDQSTGGLEDLTVLAGRTETGKTSMATRMSLAALRNNPDLAVVYLLMDDMTQDELFDQIICSEARVDYARYTEGTLSNDEQKKVDAAVVRLRQEVSTRMRTFDYFPNTHGYGESGERIFDLCRQFMEAVGAKRVLVVYDMFNDMPHPKATGAWREDVVPSIRRIESDPDHWRLEQVLDLRRRSQEICPGGWPVLALCRLRKPTSQRDDEPTIEDLLGGVELVYKAKRVFFLVPEPKADARKPVVPVTLVIKKARHAQLNRLPLLFHHTQFRFEEVKDDRVNGGEVDETASSRKQKMRRWADE